MGYRNCSQLIVDSGAELNSNSFVIKRIVHCNDIALISKCHLTTFLKPTKTMETQRNMLIEINSFFLSFDIGQLHV